MEQGGLSEIFSRANAEKQARRYLSMSFIEKPNNILGLFYILAVVYSLIKLALFSTSDAEYLIRILSIFAYTVIALFAFSNKQTAMAIGAALFVVFTVGILVFGRTLIIRAPFLVLCSFICLALTVRASHVADALRETSNKPVDVEVFD